ncbi:MAG: indole-3-glycerol-phosphate synthase [Acidimicrobiia bacterium]
MTRSLAASIRLRQHEHLMPVLSEIKVRSPKEGDLLRGRAPEDLAGAMAACPIAGLSVVTAADDFGGDLDIVRRVRPVVEVPILRKDFLRTEADLDETVAAGADAVLLTVCLQDDEELARLHAAAQARGLETLVEVHDEDDVRRVRALGLRPDVLGINNRDILVREVDDGDVTVTERLAAVSPPGALLLSESAIAGPGDAVRARVAGADAVLVGTAILQAPDPGEAIRALVGVGWP